MNAAELAAVRKEFHAHLDKCVRCETKPFDMCPIGAALLQAAANVPLMSGHIRGKA